MNSDKILTFLQKLRGILKSKLFKFVFACVLLVLTTLFFLPFFFDNSVLRFQIEQKSSEILGANLTINGGVEIDFLPLPRIVAKDVAVKNYSPNQDKNANPAIKKIYNFYAKSLAIRLPIFKSKTRPINSIVFQDAVLESYYASNSPIQRNNKLTEAFGRFANATNLNVQKPQSQMNSGFFSFPEFDSSIDIKKITIPEMIFENCNFISYNQLTKPLNTEEINASIMVGAKRIYAKGSFKNSGMKNDFEFNTRFNSSAGKKKSFLKAFSPFMQLYVKGDIVSENKGFDSKFSGSLDLEIFDLKYFYKSYFSDSNLVYRKLQNGIKPIKITSNINIENKEIEASNIAINSDSIIGKGDFHIDFSHDIPAIDLAFDLDNLDLDTILNAQSEQSENNQESLIAIDQISSKSENEDKAEQNTEDLSVNENKSEQDQSKIQPIDFELASEFKNSDISSEIGIKKLRYHSGDVLDINLYTTVSRKGEILILPLIFRIPGEGMARINGILSYSQEVPKFIGKLDANGKSLKDIFMWLDIKSQNLKLDNLKSYKLYSDLLIFPASVAISNLYLNINDGQSEFSGDVKIESINNSENIVSNIVVNKLNFDDFFLTSGQNIYLSPGSLTKKLLWLNELSTNNNITLDFDKLIYKNDEFNDQIINLQFGRGYFEIRNLQLKSDKVDIQTSLAVDLTSKEPKFNFSFIGNKFHYESKKSADEKAPKFNIIDQFFALPSLEGFFGKIDIDLASFTVDEKSFNNVKFSGKLKDGVIDKSEASIENIYSGKLSYKGLIAIKINKIINGNLSLQNIALQPLFYELFNLNSISGTANISSSVTASAVNKSEFIKNLSGETKFSVASPKVLGLGLTDLIRKMLDAQNNKNELLDADKIIFNKNAETIFKQASGMIQFNQGEAIMRTSLSAVALNSILAGKINLPSQSIDLNFNNVFLTGTRQKTIPINISTNLKGSISNPNHSTNFDQIKQYLGVRVESTASPLTIKPESSSEVQNLPNNSIPN